MWATQPWSLAPAPVESCSDRARRPSGGLPPGASLVGASPEAGVPPRCDGTPRAFRRRAGVHERCRASCSHLFTPFCCWSAGSLTPRASAAGGMPVASEFYVPLSASGGPRRAEAGTRRARQLQPLVRLRPTAISGHSFPPRHRSGPRSPGASRPHLWKAAVAALGARAEARHPEPCGPEVARSGSAAGV